MKTARVRRKVSRMSCLKSARMTRIYVSNFCGSAASCIFQSDVAFHLKLSLQNYARELPHICHLSSQHCRETCASFIKNSSELSHAGDIFTSFYSLICMDTFNFSLVVLPFVKIPSSFSTSSF